VVAVLKLVESLSENFAGVLAVLVARPGSLRFDDDSGGDMPQLHRRVGFVLQSSRSVFDFCFPPLKRARLKTGAHNLLATGAAAFEERLLNIRLRGRLGSGREALGEEDVGRRERLRESQGRDDDAAARDADKTCWPTEAA
jgi:hypothetical protein